MASLWFEDDQDDVDCEYDDIFICDDDIHCRVETNGASLCLALNLDGSTTYTSLVAQIERALWCTEEESVDVLCIKMNGEFTRSVTQDEMSWLMQAVTLKFPNLERILFEGSPRQFNRMDHEDDSDEENDENPTGEIFIQTLTDALIPRANTLTHLHLEALDLNGSASDFFHLAEAIQSMKALESVDMAIMAYVQLPVPDDRRQYLLDPFVAALSLLPHLENVAIYGYESLGSLQSQSLFSLCQKVTIKCLHLIAFSLSDENITQMSAALEDNTSMNELHLDCTLEDRGSQALSHMLRTNRGLQEFSLLCSDASLDKPANMEVIFDGLGHSKSLQRFELYASQLDAASQEALRRAMRTNTILENVDLYSGAEDPSLEMEISYYTALNCVGRGRLFQLGGEEPTTELWVELLSRCSHYPRFTFYFLSLNPALCCNPALADDEYSANQKMSDKGRRSKHQQYQARKRRRLYRAVKYNGVSYK